MEYTIEIKPKDIKANYTDSGCLIDKVAMSIGEWTENDLFENNTDYERGSFEYLLENFDFEGQLLANLNAKSEKEAEAYLKMMSHGEDYKLYKKQDLKLGAFIALNFADWFDGLLEEFTERIKEEVPSYYDSQILADEAPALLKELNESVDDFWTNLRREWLYGDRHEKGLLASFRGKIEAEAVNYDDSKDSITITWDEDGAFSFKNGCGYDYSPNSDKEIKPSKALLKRCLIEFIENGQRVESNKIKAESDKRKEEREKLKQYKKERAEQAEKERRAKLALMKK